VRWPVTLHGASKATITLTCPTDTGSAGRHTLSTRGALTTRLCPAT